VPAKRTKRRKVASRRGKYDRTMSPADRHADQRTKLLDAATAVIAANGLTETTVEAIVARAGMSRRTFYEQFDDLRDVLSEVYERAATVSLTMVQSSARAQLDPLDAIRAGLAAYFMAVANYPDVARVMFDEYRHGGPDFEARYQRDSARYGELLFEQLSKAHKKGTLSREPTEVGTFLLAKGIEAIAMRAITRGEHAKLPSSAPEIYELVVAAFR
jgi:AcrR family transcriptional regulator